MVTPLVWSSVKQYKESFEEQWEDIKWLDNTGLCLIAKDHNQFLTMIM